MKLLYNLSREISCKLYPQLKKQFSMVPKWLQELGVETWQTSWGLLRIMIPVLIITKIFEMIGVISVISIFFQPFMALMGLPGELGLVWATAMCTSIYGGFAVFMTLAPVMELTSAQITTLGAVVLIAHSLPVELSVSSKAGAGFLPIAAIRFFGALLYGMIFNGICSLCNVLQETPQLLFQLVEPATGLDGWVVEQLLNILMIVIIICAILIAMRLLRWSGGLTLFEQMLSPILPFLGMSEKAARVTIIGMLMGMTYGGALIIQEASSGKLTKKDVLNSMILLGLCHSIVEDSLLVAAMGAKFVGILWGRILFSLIILFIWVKLQTVLFKNKKEEV